ncbi:MAG: cytochrome c [Flavobacterium sp. JAD_PAG50586_2]|nr:MAG: cytochrome c [Flavobacterium sp. JAD_PAG50586_2]
MKYKILSLAILAVMVYSCASKSTTPTVAVKTSEPTVTTEPNAPIATVMTPELAEGKSLYENNCAHCHKLYDRKDFTAEEWTPIVQRMQKQANLDDLTTQKIYNYLTMN